jgi:hypothetical protein
MHDAKSCQANVADALQLVLSMVRKRDKHPKKRHMKYHKPPTRLVIVQIPQDVK